MVTGLAFARDGHLVRAHAREDFCLPLWCTHDERGVRKRFEKGIRAAERRREPLLGSVRSRGPPSPEGRPRGSSARASPRGGERRRRRAGFVTPNAARGSGAARGECPCVVAFATNWQYALGLREARHRQRSGRKPARCTSRVNGSLTTGGAQARERRDHRRQKEGGWPGFGDPHHVSAASWRRRHGFVRAPVRTGCASRLTMEDTPDRECACLSRGSRGIGLGGLRATAWDPA